MMFFDSKLFFCKKKKYFPGITEGVWGGPGRKWEVGRKWKF